MQPLILSMCFAVMLPGSIQAQEKTNKRTTPDVQVQLQVKIRGKLQVAKTHAYVDTKVYVRQYGNIAQGKNVKIFWGLNLTNCDLTLEPLRKFDKKIVQVTGTVRVDWEMNQPANLWPYLSPSRWVSVKSLNLVKK